MLNKLFIKNKAFMNWSGGKDSALCLYKALQSKKYNINCLLTNINAAYNRISMHGVQRSLLEAQAASIGFHCKQLNCLNNQPWKNMKKV